LWFIYKGFGSEYVRFKRKKRYLTKAIIQNTFLVIMNIARFISVITPLSIVMHHDKKNRC